MLTGLHVKNYVLIDSLEIDFPEGLIIITGQTGAGKSILLGALSLIMGSKADASLISGDAENCVVEAEFDVDASDDQLRTQLDDNGVEWDEGHLIVRRVVNRSGRSRAFVNDCPVSVQVLQSLASRLVDIHSQHQTLLLSDRNFQLDILDHYAGNLSQKAECAALWREMSALKSEMAQLEARMQRMTAEKDYNQAQYSQLEAASLSEGELELLEEEQKQLANAEDIKTCLSNAEEVFTCSSSVDSLSIDSSLKEVSRLLVKAGRYVPALSELSDRVDSCRRELDDILSEIYDLNSRIDMSQERLEQVESRMSLLYGLMQKHGCSDIASLIAERDRYGEMLFDSTQLEQQKEMLESKISDVSSRLSDVAVQLHLSREKAAVGFAAEIQNSIREMELPYASFEVSLVDIPLCASGKDAVMFRFSSSGKNPVEVAKCASGGELSRIMLALKAMMARYANMPTMIFDEIDTGVSGSVADKMGSVICDMGNHMQVFAITHLPQVAAKGSAHYLVSKEIEPATGVAVSKIERLSDEQRVLELARMLSGSVLTDEAVANARAFLNN